VITLTLVKPVTEADIGIAKSELLTGIESMAAGWFASRPVVAFNVGLAFANMANCPRAVRYCLLDLFGTVFNLSADVASPHACEDDDDDNDDDDCGDDAAAAADDDNDDGDDDDGDDSDDDDDEGHAA
jgi:hypothetical protein